MTDQDRIKRLAHWMGWHIEEWNTELWIFTDVSSELSYWNPLVNIQDAWMLIEKLKEKWADLDLYYAFEDQPGDGWYFGIGMKNIYVGPYDTAPLAICAATEKIMECRDRP